MPTYTPPNAPNTFAIMQSIQSYMQSIVWGTSSQFSLVQIEEIKDITNQVVGMNACLEIYGGNDDSQHFAFGGKIRDEQDFILLALVSKDTTASIQQIYQIRDQLVVPFQIHATLNNAGTVFHSQVKPKSGAYMDIKRNNQWLRGYRLRIQTQQEWFVPTPPGVIS